MDIRIGVIGLGYVGLPLALAFGRKFGHTVGFDINGPKVERLLAGEDPTDEGFEEAVRSSTVTFTSDAETLRGCNFFVVGVPTPIDRDNRPDLGPVESASRFVGSVLSPGSVVVFESTVYPGVTEEVCGPILEQVSGLVRGKDFFLGYSPERINPGDKERTLERIVKVVAGEDEDTLDLVASVYGKVIEAGVYRAATIKVAEAAKVIENTQRDLNIALMNELSLIFDRMGVDTKEVLEAAGTKWNFLPFRPGLVGGHCIGVDPYYLTTKAEQLGYHPQVILAGRRINDEMGKVVAQKLVKLLVTSGSTVKDARVGILGVTFKENVTDLRNSRVPDIYRELAEFGVSPVVYDPMCSSDDCLHEYGFPLSDVSEFRDLDGLVYAVPHRALEAEGHAKIFSMLRPGGVIVDVKMAMDRSAVPAGLTYWRL